METVSVPVRRAVFERLQKMAIPLVDDASSVIERLISHWESNPPKGGGFSLGGGGSPSPANEPQAQAWHSARGEEFRIGTQLRASYLGKTLLAKVTPEGIEFAGKLYDNPSSAGIAAKNSVGTTGKAASTNGWDFWEMQIPGSQRWVSIDVLRSTANS